MILLEEKGKHLPYGALSSGFYSDHTLGCFLVMRNAWPLVKAALDRMLSLTHNKESLSLIDFGCADGGTSLPLWHSIIKRISIFNNGRTKSALHTMMLYFNDQPSNDFSSLFMRMAGNILLPEMTYITNRQDELQDSDFVSNPTSSIYEALKLEDLKIFACGVGRSFYDQVIPSKSLDFGLSATAMHWLSRLPCLLPRFLHSLFLSPLYHTPLSPTTNTAALYDEFRRQSSKDWKRILDARSDELHIGGQLVLINLAIDPQGRFLGHTFLPCKENTIVLANGDRYLPPKNCLWTVMNDEWQKMVNEGCVLLEEFERMTFCQHYRTMDELLEPWGVIGQNVSSESVSPSSLRPYNDSLKLVKWYTDIVPCSYRREWLSGSKYRNDAVTFANHFILSIRTWSNSTFVAALESSSENRSQQEANAIVDQFFHRLSQRIAAAPDDFGMDYVHAYLHIEKIAEKVN